MKKYLGKGEEKEKEKEKEKRDEWRSGCLMLNKDSFFNENVILVWTELNGLFVLLLLFPSDNLALANNYL